VRFHCLRRDFKGSSDALIAESFANHPNDIALSCRYCFADAAAGLCGAAIPRASVAPGKLTFPALRIFAGVWNDFYARRASALGETVLQPIPKRQACVSTREVDCDSAVAIA
jgi:hypothetical protein